MSFDQHPPTEELIETITRQTDDLRTRLPEKLIFKFNPDHFEAPHLACVLVGSLICRSEELGRNALQMLEQRHLVSAALLSRAILENAAAIFALRHYVSKRETCDPETFYKQIEALVFGSRILNEPQDLNISPQPKSVSVLTHLKRLVEEEPTIMDNYDFMSEISHPNGVGVMGFFCTFNQKNHTTEFGRNDSNIELITQGAALNLSYSLRVFLSEYIKTNVSVVEWLATIRHRQ